MQTIRQPLPLSRPETRLSLRFSNETGGELLSIGRATIALSGRKPGQILAGSALALTFAGKRAVRLPPGQTIWSDPVTMPSTREVVLDLFVDRATGVTAMHPMGRATSFISDDGDETGQTDLGSHDTTNSRFFVTMVKAFDPQATGTIVALGESITDGAHSTPDANTRWPDILAHRLEDAGLRAGVVNQGLAGNRLVHDAPLMSYGPSALRRFERDVLSVPGVKTVIVLEGINDIGLPRSSGLPEQEVTAAQMIEALKTLVHSAHRHRARVVLGTLPPFQNAAFPRYFDKPAEAKREAVNAWIRCGKVADEVVDFDALLRDPQHPEELRAEYDSGDHLHPNDAGYRIMAEGIDLQNLAQDGSKRPSSRR